MKHYLIKNEKNVMSIKIPILEKNHTWKIMDLPKGNKQM